MADDRKGQPQQSGAAGDDQRAQLVQPTAQDPDPHGIYIDEVQGHNRRLRKIISFTQIGRASCRERV